MGFSQNLARSNLFETREFQNQHSRTQWKFKISSFCAKHHHIDIIFHI